MTTSQLLSDSLADSGKMLLETASEFSDAECLTRPCTGANHPLWQLGHLTVVENRTGNHIKPGAMPELPANFAGKFAKEAAKLDDPASFPSKEVVLGAFAAQRARTVEMVRMLTEEELDRPGPEPYRHLAPSVGRLLTLALSHGGMHLGQLQVARRKCGKPVKF